MIDPDLNRYNRLVTQCGDLARLLRKWPRQQGGDSEIRSPSVAPGVPINVAAIDLSDETFACMVSWAREIAEERGIVAPDSAAARWRATPSGTVVPIGPSSTRGVEVVEAWLRRHGEWTVERDWWPEMDEELSRLVRRGRGVTGFFEVRPKDVLVDEVLSVLRKRGEATA